jgi:ferredoxin-NADP reductase
MAIAKTARVVGDEMIGGDTCLVDLEAPVPLGFVGGQYIIVDSRLVLPNGKAVKRAYSLLTADAEQTRFQIAVKRIPDGLGSGFMHALEVGAEISFSGPWGKFFPQEGAAGATLMLATDTGITATLGLVQAMRCRPLLADTVFIWMRTSPDYFLPETFVRERIPASCGEIRIEAIPAIGHPERVPHARAILRQVSSGVTLARAFSSGDGAVNYALLDDLAAARVPATRDNVESFFNMPKKSA